MKAENMVNKNNTDHNWDPDLDSNNLLGIKKKYAILLIIKNKNNKSNRHV